MNKLFKDIRHSDVDAVRVAISKNITVVNEVYTAKAPKKDIGQSPLQVAIKCGEFEIIELLLENGADPDFMENPELVPPHSVCMSVLHDAIIEASNPVTTPLLGHRCRSSQEITGSPTPFLTSNHYLWICESASFSLSNPNIAA